MQRLHVSCNATKWGQLRFSTRTCKTFFNEMSLHCFHKTSTPHNLNSSYPSIWNVSDLCWYCRQICRPFTRGRSAHLSNKGFWYSFVFFYASSPQIEPLEPMFTLNALNDAVWSKKVSIRASLFLYLSCGTSPNPRFHHLSIFLTGLSPNSKFLTFCTENPAKSKKSNNLNGER